MKRTNAAWLEDLRSPYQDQAIEDLRYVVDNVGDDPEYKRAEEILHQLEQKP